MRDSQKTSKYIYVFDNEKFPRIYRMIKEDQDARGKLKKHLRNLDKEYILNKNAKAEMTEEIIAYNIRKKILLQGQLTTEKETRLLYLNKGPYCINSIGCCNIRQFLKKIGTDGAEKSLDALHRSAKEGFSSTV